MYSVIGRWISLCVVVTAVPGVVSAQVRWTVDAKSSSVRWEVAPHWNQLRATTCPEDPAWQPGEGTDHAKAHQWDAYLRAAAATARACTEAVTGSLTTKDTTIWSGVSGIVTVKADRLVTGLGMRDRYAHKVVLETLRYPEIRFAIDSLSGITKGDTLLGRAVGVFELRGVSQPMAVPVKAWREGNGLRVLAQFQIPARDLLERYHMSEQAVGMPVRHGVWKALEIEIEAVLTPEPSDVTASR
jgi:hypothetical protein